jgi:hypothetical protein
MMVDEGPVKLRERATWCTSIGEVLDSALSVNKCSAPRHHRYEAFLSRFRLTFSFLARLRGLVLMLYVADCLVSK